MQFLDYEERPALSPEAAAYHDRVVALGESAKGVEYAYGDHPLQRVLVFAAAEPSGETLLALHGGRWSHGYKEWMAMMAPPLNRRGITLVSAGYRLGPTYPFPAGLADCGRALQWVQKELARFGGSPNAIFVNGHSSGAHYAALLAAAPHNAGVGELPPIAGCLAMSGLFLIEKGSIPPPLLEILFPNGTTEEMCALASPLRADLRGAPAFHITWGSKDAPPVVSQSAMMVKELQKAGVQVKGLELDGLDHFETHCAAADLDGAWIRDVEEFVRQHRVHARSSS